MTTPVWTRVTKSLGWLWVIDGLLQLQPSQFGSNFAVMIEMNAMAQPPVVAHLELAFGHFIGSHGAPWTVVIAVVQVVIGVGMLVTRSRRVALGFSIAWALAIWAVGEGFGSIATGFALVQTGAPGPALLYATIACALLAFQNQDFVRLQVALRSVWTVLWLSAAALQLASPISRALVLRANLDETGAGEPAMFASLDRHAASFSSAHASCVTAAMVLIDVVLALLPWYATRRDALWASLAVLAFGWVVGENLGGLLTGSASDVGIAPLFALVAYIAYPSARTHPKAPRVRTYEGLLTTGTYMLHDPGNE